MPRFFVTPDQIPEIKGTDAHHIRHVLRMQVGDQLELLDGTGKIYTAKIAQMSKEKIICTILSEKIEKSESKVSITIAQCLPKAKKMDLIIQKCTELGVAKIIPVISERSVAKGEKLERWKKIAKEASEQCGRATIPEISPLLKFSEVLKLAKDYDLALIPWELEDKTTLKKILTGLEASRPAGLVILVGPEGGFSTQEVELVINAGFKSISLGKRILRTETAGMAILSMINYEYSQ